MSLPFSVHPPKVSDRQHCSEQCDCETDLPVNANGEYMIENASNKRIVKLRGNNPRSKAAMPGGSFVSVVHLLQAIRNVNGFGERRSWSKGH